MSIIFSFDNSDCQKTDLVGLATDDELAANLFKHTINALSLKETTFSNMFI